VGIPSPSRTRPVAPINTIRHSARLWGGRRPVQLPPFWRTWVQHPTYAPTRAGLRRARHPRVGSSYSEMDCARYRSNALRASLERLHGEVTTTRGFILLGNGMPTIHEKRPQSKPTAVSGAVDRGNRARIVPSFRHGRFASGIRRSSGEVSDLPPLPPFEPCGDQPPTFAQTARMAFLGRTGAVRRLRITSRITQRPALAAAHIPQDAVWSFSRQLGRPSAESPVAFSG